MRAPVYAFGAADSGRDTRELCGGGTVHVISRVVVSLGWLEAVVNGIRLTCHGVLVHEICHFVLFLRRLFSLTFELQVHLVRGEYAMLLCLSLFRLFVQPGNVPSCRSLGLGFLTRILYSLLVSNSPTIVRFVALLFIWRANNSV